MDPTADGNWYIKLQICFLSWTLYEATAGSSFALTFDQSTFVFFVHAVICIHIPIDQTRT
jgi:hypothetical protein